MLRWRNSSKATKSLPSICDGSFYHAMIGDVSYVINDPVATKEMMKLVEVERTPARLSRQDTLIRATPQAVPARTATVTAALVRAPATAQETPIITIRATPMHREPEGPTTAAMLTTVTLITVTLTTPAERVEPAGTTTELLLAVRAVPTVQADTTPAIPIRHLRRDGIRCLAGVSLGSSNCASGIGFDRCRFLIGSSTGRLSFGSPVEFSYPLRDTGDHRLQRRMGLAKT